MNLNKWFALFIPKQKNEVIQHQTNCWRTKYCVSRTRRAIYIYIYVLTDVSSDYITTLPILYCIVYSTQFIVVSIVHSCSRLAGGRSGNYTSACASRG